MKKCISVLLPFIILFFSEMVIAQNASDKKTYVVFEYIKVEPKMEADYLKFEAAAKKVHAQRKKEGKLVDWTLEKVISPEGKNWEYNYVVVFFYSGSTQLAAALDGHFFPDNFPALSPDDIDILKKRDEVSTFIKQDVWSITDQMLEKSMNTKVVVITRFSTPVGKTFDDHMKVENEIWKPVHKERINDGIMTGWALSQQEMQFGASFPNNIMATDLYPSMKDYLEERDVIGKYFAKVHQGKSINALMKQTTDATTPESVEVRMIVDRL